MLSVHCVDKSLSVLAWDLWVIIALKNSYLSKSGALGSFNTRNIHLKDKNQALFLVFVSFLQNLVEICRVCWLGWLTVPTASMSAHPGVKVSLFSPKLPHLLLPPPCVCIWVLHWAHVCPSFPFPLFLQAAGAVHRLSTVSLTAGDHRRPALPKHVLVVSLTAPLYLSVLLPSPLPVVRWDLNHDVFLRPATQHCLLSDVISNQAHVRPGVSRWEEKKRGRQTGK